MCHLSWSVGSLEREQTATVRGTTIRQCCRAQVPSRAVVAPPRDAPAPHLRHLAVCPAPAPCRLAGFGRRLQPPPRRYLRAVRLATSLAADRAQPALFILTEACA